MVGTIALFYGFHPYTVEHMVFFRNKSLFWPILVVFGLPPFVAGASMPVGDASGPATVLPPIPRIGVVLGGGGARGFAHLGVLRELEKLHIPISCISGTSAGALVGGMYANGLSLDDMQSDFRQANWSRMLSGRPDRADVPYERKSDDYKNYFDITFGLRNGVFKLPRSAINAQDVDLYIRQLTKDRVIDSFDKLPIPFRAVATNLATGDAVVFDAGSLATALRASMAVPALFDPVSNDGMLLIDGGVARNLPIQDIKNRCADHVIVVDVGSPLLKTDEIHNVFDVLAQTSNLLVARNVQQQLALLDSQDIIVKPDLTGFSATDFQSNQEIIARGEVSVAKVLDRLKAWSVPPAVYAVWHARLQAPPVPQIDKVEVLNSPGGFVNPARLEQNLQKAAKGRDLDMLRENLQQMFAGGDYDSLNYRVEQIDSKNVLQVLPVDRSVGPTYLQFGLNFKSSTTSNAQINFLGQSLWTWVNSAGATWRNDVQLGSEGMFRSEFYQPSGLGSPFFVSAQAHYKQDSWSLYDSSHRQYAELTVDRTGADLNGGYTLGQYGQVRGGLFWEQFRPRQTMGVTTPQILSSEQGANQAGAAVSAVADQFDNPRWPRRGYYLSADLRYSLPQFGGVNSRYYAMTAEDAITFGNLTVRLTGKVKGNLQNDDGRKFIMPQFLGGFLNLSGYDQNELYGEKIALGRMMVYWRAATLPSALGSGLYAGVSLEAGQVWQQNFTGSNTGWLPGGSLFLGADTIIGPFFIGLGNAKGGRPIGYMVLGLDY